MGGHDSDGFTLVELMMVVLVIGILVAVAVPIFNAAQASATVKTCFANQRNVEGCAQTYQAAHGSLPAAGTVDGSHVLISAGYIKQPPKCPFGLQNYALDASGTVTDASLTCGHTHY